MVKSDENIIINLLHFRFPIKVNIDINKIRKSK